MHIRKRLLTGKLVVITFLLIPVIFTGCGLWNNFTAYFNIYYNAAKSFDEAETIVKDQKKNIFSTLEPRPTGAASDAFNKVIEKLSKLLQFNSESDLVDNSLLMLGKSFYYQQDYQKALRKFTELISTFPNSDLALEAQLWLGKTQLRLRNYDQATSTLNDVVQKAKEKDDSDILSDAYIQQTGYLLSQEKYDDAITSLQQLLSTSKDGRINAAVMYEMGKTYLKLNKPEDAAKAFAGVLDYDPTYDMEYSAKLQYGKVQRSLGNLERALNIFTDMGDEHKYDSYKDSTELQMGLTYLDMKRYDDAFSEFTRVDTAYKQSPNSGVAQYYKGEILETRQADYDSANYYYKKAMSSAAPQEYTQKAAKKVQNFAKYDNLSAAIDMYEKQLSYVEDPKLYVQDSIAYASEQAVQDSLAKEKAKQIVQQNEEKMTNRRDGRREDTQRQPQQQMQTGQTNKKSPPVMPKISADSIRTLLAKNEYELGSLFFTELNVPDSAYYYYNHIVTSYPGNPYMGRTLYALGSYYLTKDNKAKADSLFEVIYSDYNNESIVNAAASKLGKPLINLKYDEAEELFVHAEQKMKDSLYNQAISEFRNIYHNYPKSSYAPKALYASGWIYENNLDMPDSAAAVYDSVLAKFPTTAYANAVRGKMQVFNDEKKKEQAVRDSINNAKNNLNKPENQQKLDQSPQMADSLSKSPNTNNANVNEANTPQNLQQNNNQNTQPGENKVPGQNNQPENQGSGHQMSPGERPALRDTVNVNGQNSPGTLKSGAPKDTTGTQTQPKDSSNTSKNSGKKNSRVRRIER
ncbi:MAG TPA: tetratricopeptide repeat protein [Ignavibacteriales bacterium]|nr:tetratricopeptide repeat protein [Ignavibacteriales bacterium]